MSKYRVWIDPRAAETRAELRRLQIKDFAEKSLRWALHMSEEEVAFLEANNPETLGCLCDPRQYKAEWARFIAHPESSPFRVGTGT